jgi:hypothetical protein
MLRTQDAAQVRAHCSGPKTEMDCGEDKIQCRLCFFRMSKRFHWIERICTRVILDMTHGQMQGKLYGEVTMC